jgi:hypothetical protein
MAADGPKSSFELAMERLRLKDKEAGVDEHPLTDTQKAAIAEARQVYEARVAEREILHQAALTARRALIFFVRVDLGSARASRVSLPNAISK